MKLYYDPVTVNCRKVLAGLDLIGAAFNEEKVDYFGGGHTSPEYTAINPNQSLPTLVDDGFTVWESNAILQYAADKHEIFRRRNVRRANQSWQTARGQVTLDAFKIEAQQPNRPARFGCFLWGRAHVLWARL